MRSSLLTFAGPAAGPAPGPVSGLSGLRGPGRGLYRRWLKRGFDLVLVLLTAPATLPLIAILALMVACDGGRPFYSQDRLGRGGRVFRIWKLRSMCPDAEAALAAHLAADPEARAEWDSTQKLRSDPRITRLGRLLRKSSLDELPQLWNVLRGEMSLIGPRPMMPEQRPLYPGRAYFAMRPGISGLWQVAARNSGAFAERAAFDSRYHEAISFGADLRLLLATLRVVLRGTGC
ncbi:sugar transferase [Limimaricola pyoseonensis]|uniref:sugar transferase n=1 Tax=Limimaricola pyoseonensis TaxID=521013 RepID=UPI003BFA26EB